MVCASVCLGEGKGCADVIWLSVSFRIFLMKEGKRTTATVCVQTNAADWAENTCFAV